MDIEADWKSCVLSGKSTIKDAISNLDKTGFQIVLIVASDVLLGAVTDGDIRRGLLRGLSMESPVDTIMNRHPLVVPPKMPREQVLHLFKVNKIMQLPIINIERQIVGLYLLNNIDDKKNKSNLMVIMAGGMGTRLRPYTENCPKPLLQISGRPMLEHIILRAKAEGFNRFILAIRYLGHMIEDYFQDGSFWGVEIDYLREQSPLGTAGALRLLTETPNAPFLVTNGDILTDVRYGELLDFHIRHAAIATMAIRQHEWQHPFGIVQMKGVNIVGFDEKPISLTHVNAGIYVLDPNALNFLHHGEHCDMPTLFERIRLEGLHTIAYPIYEPWLDVGEPNSLAVANANEAMEY